MPQYTVRPLALPTGAYLGSRAGWLMILASVAALVFFVLWVELSPATLGPLTVEDGPIENVSAFLFFVSGVGFLIAARRSEYLRSRRSLWAYCMIVAWAGLAFVCCGEEISWGQRILQFDSPQTLKVINAQEEFNVHNLYAFAATGGTYRYLTIFILLTGLGIPALASTDWGRRLFRRFAFPVAPWVIAPAFIGAYLFGKYYIDIAPSLDVSPPNAINETRELMIGYAMAAYGLFGAFMPDALFGQSGVDARESAQAPLRAIDPARN